MFKRIRGGNGEDGAGRVRHAGASGAAGRPNGAGTNRQQPVPMAAQNGNAVDQQRKDSAGERLRSLGVTSSPVKGPEDEAEAKRRKKLLNLRVELHRKLLDTLNLSAIEKVTDAELRAEIGDIVREELRSGELVLSRPEFENLVKELVDEVMGLGPLEPLLADESITDILVNGHDNCYVERKGKLVKSEVQFKDNPHLMRVINKIVSAVGRRVDESQPWVDA
ncbi:MAG: ATPase, T2SS/T4P/T4SS family, partial [Pseudomonadota bacterium]